MRHLHEFIQKLGDKPQWGTKELRSELHQVVMKEGEAKSKKKNKVQKLQKYDLIYLSLYGGVPHYILVEKVIGNKVFGIGFTSSEGEHNSKIVEKDRLLKGSWFSDAYCIVSLETALSSFVRVYENKTEANLVFKQVKQNYNGLFLGRNRQNGKHTKLVYKPKKEVKAIKGVLQ